MSGHPTYQPQNAFMRWMERRLPIAGLIYSSFVVYPMPRNLNYWWTFGGILAFMLGVQIVTGIVLAMHYTPHVDFAFNSVEAIMRDVNYGWLLRYLHANGASMFFLAAYIHMFRGMYYGSYKEPREVLWILGVILLLLMIMTGFMGYVLPWGQMSFWAATVITNLFSAIPLVGEPIVTWLWGGYAVGNPTLNRFYSLHYLLPFVIVGVVVLHIWALHMVGQNNPTGIEPKTEHDTVAFTPYATIKDGFLLVVFCILFGWLVFYIPNFLGHSDNYIPANPAVTPMHIVPEWYYLPFYAILRAIPNKLLGVVALGRLDRDPRFPAVARYFESEVGALSSALPAVLLAVRDRLHRARLARIEAAGRQLRAVRSHFHGLLFRLFPDHPAVAGPHREAQAGAELDCRIGAARGRAGRRLGAAAGAREGLRRAAPWPCSANPGIRSRRRPVPRSLLACGERGRRDADAAQAQMVVRRAVRQIRSRATPARLQGLSRGLPGLSRHHAAVVPQSGRAGRARILGRAGRRHRGRIPGQGRAGRPGRGQGSRRPSRGPFPAAVHQRAGGACPLQRGAARHVGDHQGARL